MPKLELFLETYSVVSTQQKTDVSGIQLDFCNSTFFWNKSDSVNQLDSGSASISTIRCFWNHMGSWSGRRKNCSSWIGKTFLMAERFDGFRERIRSGAFEVGDIESWSDSWNYFWLTVVGELTEMFSNLDFKFNYWYWEFQKTYGNFSGSCWSNKANCLLNLFL